MLLMYITPIFLFVNTVIRLITFYYIINNKTFLEPELIFLAMFESLLILVIIVQENTYHLITYISSPILLIFFCITSEYYYDRLTTIPKVFMLLDTIVILNDFGKMK